MVPQSGADSLEASAKSLLESDVLDGDSGKSALLHAGVFMCAQGSISLPPRSPAYLMMVPRAVQVALSPQSTDQHADGLCNTLQTPKSLLCQFSRQLSVQSS